MSHDQDNTYSLAAIQSLFTAEISDSEVIYLTKVYKSKRFNRDSILDVETYCKETETFEFLNIFIRVGETLVSFTRRKERISKRSVSSPANKFVTLYF